MRQEGEARTSVHRAWYIESLQLALARRMACGETRLLVEWYDPTTTSQPSCYRSPDYALVGTAAGVMHMRSCDNT
jgi:hypothetical protein